MTAPDPAELRIACVMNGGVSLAVWMAGVTHEIDLLRRASSGVGAAEADVPAYDRALWQRWQDAARKRRVVVDIVAGTSAGGINGTLLAAAIAGDGRLDWPDGNRRGPFLRHLWEQEAGLEKLLPRPDDRTVRSLLKGEHLERVITDTLGKVAEESSRYSGVTKAARHPVTLFVTATALGESDDHYCDGFDQEFRTQDHRRRYRFRYDPDHVKYSDQHTFVHQDLSEFEGCREALARATRASSSYPVAFEPVPETRDMLGPPVRVQPRKPAATASWLADGGILDNSPFEPVLQEIARRAPDADVKRLLVYVVPSRGTPPEGGEPGRLTADIPEWTAVLGSALRFPTEADFREDIAEMRERLFTANAQQQAVRLFCTSAHGPGPSDAGEKLVGGAMALLPMYWRGRVAGRIREARTLAEESGTRGAPLRLSAPEDVLKTVDALSLLPEGQRGTPQPDFGPDVSVLDVPWRWGVGAGERCARLFARDVMDHLAQGAPIGRQAQGLADVLRRILALSRALDERLSELSPAQLTDIAEARTLVEQTADALEVPDRMQELMKEAAGHYATAVPAIEATIRAKDVARVAGADDAARVAVTVAVVARVALAVEICDRAVRAGTPYQRVPPFTLLRLGPDVDAPGLSGIAGDGARGAELGDRKLYGIRAGHFAAFARAEWRRHDWLWGRLDAIAHLGRALLAGEDESKITPWIRDSQQLALANELDGPSMQELWTSTSELVRASDEDLLEQVKKAGGGQMIRDIQKRAARMVADEMDIGHVPEWAEQALASWLLKKFAKRIGVSNPPVG